jgi:(E)-4-hydroxy-3-methylbut-2-enyl-diphosphate synthase
MSSEVQHRASRPIRLLPARRRAREVSIGDVVLGGERAIAVQSMTTTRTADAPATAAQIAALARAGCAIVRVTVPSKPDAEALPEIRRILARESVSVPIVADIHFTPTLALAVVEHVEKVRVNPGNFVDKKTLDEGRYDEARWERDVARLHDKFAPLVDRAKELGVAMRIGTNHGSLSDRILHRWGDTPRGMVESALEFVRICEDRGYHDIVISMKASNTQVMTRAYRLLVEHMDAAHEPYPLHLGVTEAGGGDEGRVKSSVGIATLLAEGLGDTVRVSLTEDPVAEVPVAAELVERFGVPSTRREPSAPLVDVIEVRDALDPVRRETARVELVPGVAYGGDEVPRVELTVRPGVEIEPIEFARPPVEVVDAPAASVDEVGASLDLLAGFRRDDLARAVTLTTPAAREALDDDELRRRIAATCARVGFVVDDAAELDELPDAGPDAARLIVLRVRAGLADGGAEAVERFGTALAGRGPRLAAALEIADPVEWIDAHRLLAAALDRAGARVPIVLQESQGGVGDPRVGTGGRLGGMLVDGLGDAVRLPAGDEPRIPIGLAHGILQAARRRLERAEFIACPSCGRTLFDLEETTARIRELTEHLKLKIGVMGCVVNGPGEMADADYGYVGWGEGKVALFVGRTMVEKDIPFSEAPGRLVELIKERGDWTDPEDAPTRDAEA